jgi:hypothetical protein
MNKIENAHKLIFPFLSSQKGSMNQGYEQYKQHFFFPVIILLNNILIGYRITVKHLSYTLYMNTKKS